MGLLLQPRDVIRQRVDLLVGEPSRHAGHVAGIVGALLGAEILQLLDDVVVFLAGDARDLVLAGEAAEVARIRERFGRF